MRWENTHPSYCFLFSSSTYSLAACSSFASVIALPSASLACVVCGVCGSEYQTWEPTLRMSETRKEVLADSFSCSIFAADNSCSSFSTFASASILCEYILVGSHVPPSASHLFENVFLDFDEGCFFVGALGCFHQFIRGLPHCIACHFQPLHALGPRIRLHLVDGHQLVDNNIKGGSPDMQAPAGPLLCSLASPKPPSEFHRSRLPGRRGKLVTSTSTCYLDRKVGGLAECLGG